MKKRDDITKIYLAIVIGFALLCAYCVYGALQTPVTGEHYIQKEGE